MDIGKTWRDFSKEYCTCSIIGEHAQNVLNMDDGGICASGGDEDIVHPSFYMGSSFILTI